MKAVVPVKGNSTRVPNKNFRPFNGTDSLTDLVIDKLSRQLPREDIFVSSESLAGAAIAERRGVNFLPRSLELTHNETPLTDVVTKICADIPGDDDILWCQVVDPLFDDYARAMDTWETVRAHHDSLAVVYRRSGYFLDAEFRPDGFGFGPWHTPSQQLPDRYQLSFTLFILKRETILRVQYYIGASPYWYCAPNRSIDIDSEDDFNAASAYYRWLQERPQADV